MYDFAHPLSDAKEGVTHSLCSLEFENHRPLYDWFLKACEIEQPPRQIEFARLNLNYCLTSKRKCLALVNEGIVDGWDDPRMVTLSGMRRRGYPAAAIRDFCDKIGVSKAYSVVDMGLLEACVRDALNSTAPRAMAVLDPIELIIENYPDGQTEDIEIPVHPDHPEMGTRTVKFSKHLFIERDDFMAEPVKKYFRLYPGNEVRLKSAYFVKCTRFETDEQGNPVRIYCTYDPESKGGESPDGRKVKGTIHWVSRDDCFRQPSICMTDFSMFRIRLTRQTAISSRTLTLIHLLFLKIALSRAALKMQKQAMYSSLCVRVISVWIRIPQRIIRYST